jgi:hypothetical protein
VRIGRRVQGHWRSEGGLSEACVPRQTMNTTGAVESHLQVRPALVGISVCSPTNLVFCR